MIEQTLDSVLVVQLKGLKNLRVDFGSERVTGIFGVNGCGKSTLLQALACLYQPEDNKEHAYRFTEFFKRVNYNKWAGSKMIATMTVNHDQKTVEYGKKGDRWTPRKNKHPRRPVTYVGLMSCVPDVERVVSYVTGFNIAPGQLSTVDNNAKIVKKASEILGYKYEELASGKLQNRTLRKVRKAEGLEYTSLSMGAGEQRLFELLQILYSMPAGALLLIDEIDLTLHTRALHKLMEFIVEIANARKMQVVFTSHREELLARTDIGILHVWKDAAGNSYCVKGVTEDALFRLTGKSTHRLRIFVEDDLASAIVQKVAAMENMRREVEVIKFGSIENAFIVVAGLEIAKMPIQNMMFLLDGDRYCTKAERLDRMEKVYSGDEQGRAERRRLAVEQIRQLILPTGRSPEQYLVDQLKNAAGELADLANDINTTIGENHTPFQELYERLGGDRSALNSEIVEALSKLEFWSDYTMEVREWLRSHKGHGVAS